MFMVAFGRVSTPTSLFMSVHHIVEACDVVVFVNNLKCIHASVLVISANQRFPSTNLDKRVNRNSVNNSTLVSVQASCHSNLAILIRSYAERF